MLLSTVHRIKGREWDHVIVFGASRGLFPHRLANDEEGERRVFHVALTRARSQVVVLADADAPSIFLAELDGTRVVPPPAPHPGPSRAGPGRAGPGRPRRGGAAGLAAAAAAKHRRARLCRAQRQGADRHRRAGPPLLTALAACRGMGPIRLERWGDEILAVLEGALDPA